MFSVTPSWPSLDMDPSALIVRSITDPRNKLKEWALGQETGLLSPWQGAFGAEASEGQSLEDVAFTSLNQFMTTCSSAHPSQTGSTVLTFF